MPRLRQRCRSNTYGLASIVWDPLSIAQVSIVWAPSVSRVYMSLGTCEWRPRLRSTSCSVSDSAVGRSDCAVVIFATNFSYRHTLCQYRTSRRRCIGGKQHMLCQYRTSLRRYIGG
eukprot:1887258-Rhodomonas_salina.2